MTYYYDVLNFLESESAYFFSWGDVPGDDTEKLINFILHDLDDVSWAENAEIHKSDDGKTIHIFKDENSVEIIMEDPPRKATLKISDGKIRDLYVKTENGKLNVYLRNRRRYCDDCLSNILQIRGSSPRQQIQQNCTRLDNQGKINRRVGRCYKCDKTYKLVNWIETANETFT